MSYGVTTDGFVLKTFQVIQTETRAYVRSKISKFLKLDEKTGLGNVVNSGSDQTAQVWEAAQGAYYAFDPLNADDESFVALCEVTGTKRNGAQRGSWDTTCTLAAGKTFAVGDLVANVAGQPGNRWYNSVPVTATAETDYFVPFISQTLGSSAKGDAGSLVIAQNIDGWIAVATSVAATPGLDEETIEELALRREAELQGSGSGPIGAIVSNLSKVAGVISVRGSENKTDLYDSANGVAPHAFRVVIWDGAAPAASNNDIAAAILAGGSAGIQSMGLSSGTAVDKAGKTQIVPFDRATQIPIYVTCTVTGTAALADIQAAIVKKGASLTSGNNVVAEKIRAAITNTPGVTDLLAFAIGTAPSPTLSANIPISIGAIGLYDATRISVTFA